MNLNRFLFRLKQSPSTHTICSTMASSQISSKAGRCRQTAKTRLLWFREAGNVKKGWELMGVHMLLSDAKVLFNFLIHWLVFNNYFSFAQQRSRKSLGCWLRSLPNPLKQILERLEHESGFFFGMKRKHMLLLNKRRSWKMSLRFQMYRLSTVLNRQEA